MCGGGEAGWGPGNKMRMKLPTKETGREEPDF